MPTVFLHREQNSHRYIVRKQLTNYRFNMRDTFKKQPRAILYPLSDIRRSPGEAILASSLGPDPEVRSINFLQR